MALYLLENVPVRQLDNNGDPVAGALLHTWTAGTTTDLTAYADKNGVTPLSNPIVADSEGFWPAIWLQAKVYDLEARKPDDVTVLWTRDSANAGNASFDAFVEDLSDADVKVHQPYDGAADLTQHEFNSEWLNVLQFGNKTIGTADDTMIINIALSAASVTGQALWAPPGTATVSPLVMPSNVRLICHPKFILKAKAGYGLNDCLMDFNGASNFTFDGNGSLQQMLKAEYTTGEQRHVFRLINCTNIRLNGCNAIDSGGDGYYVGRETAGGTHARNVWLNNCRASNNRRQGLSVVSAENFWANNCIFENTIGTKPACGIDIEPNDGLDVLTNINITNCRTTNNQGGGILVALRAFSGTAGNTVSIKITGHVSSDDGNTVAGENVAAFMCVGSNGGAWGNVVMGDILYQGATIVNPQGSGIRSNRQDAARAPMLYVRDVVIVNPGSGTSPAIEDACGLVIWSQDAGGSDWGNIDAQNVRVYDNRGTPVCYAADYCYGTTGLSGIGQARNVRLLDVVAVGFTPTSGRWAVLLADMANSSVEFTQEQLVTDFPLNTDPARTRSFAGFTIAQPAGGVIQLPRASLNTGLSWRFRQTTDATSIQIRPDSNDTIDYAHAQGSDLVLSRKEAFVHLRMSPVANVVETVRVHDLAKRVGGTGGFASSAPPGRVYYGTAPPATGSWLIADQVTSSAPGVGSPKGWTCTVSGTPGTWVSQGNL